MAKKKLVLKPLSAKALQAQGKLLGLDAAFIIKLIGLLGPELVSLILKWLKPQPKLGFVGGELIKKIIVDFIVNSRDQILEWIESGEEALYEALVALVASKSQGAAMLLEQYKKTILKLDDSIQADVIDRLIAILKGETN